MVTKLTLITLTLLLIVGCSPSEEYVAATKDHPSGSVWETVTGDTVEILYFSSREEQFTVRVHGYTYNQPFDGVLRFNVRDTARVFHRKLGNTMFEALRRANDEQFNVRVIEFKE